MALGLSLHDSAARPCCRARQKQSTGQERASRLQRHLAQETPSTTDDSPSISSMPGSEALGQEYSILATPSFTPGVEDSPFVTWGDIQGTPLRLDPEDDIEVDPAGASGPNSP